MDVCSNSSSVVQHWRMEVLSHSRQRLQHHDKSRRRLVGRIATCDLHAVASASIDVDGNTGLAGRRLLHILQAQQTEMLCIVAAERQTVA